MFGKNKKGNVSDSEYGAMLGGHLNFAASEAYKLLRTNLMYALTGEEKDECRVVGVTSSVRGEGKSHHHLKFSVLHRRGGPVRLGA